MIAGLEIPTDGDIFVRGERVNDIPVQKRNIGFVFQNYALFKNMTVFKNIAFGLKIKKWKTRGHRGARCRVGCNCLGCVDWKTRYPHQLSGGQRASASPSPAHSRRNLRVLLLDEPFGALDAKIRQELRANGSCICTTT